MTEDNNLLILNCFSKQYTKVKLLGTKYWDIVELGAGASVRHFQCIAESMRWLVTTGPVHCGHRLSRLGHSTLGFFGVQYSHISQSEWTQSQNRIWIVNIEFVVNSLLVIFFLNSNIFSRKSSKPKAISITHEQKEITC